jgi:hypothetical protein
MLVVNTTQFGKIGIEFEHNTGDPNKAFKRALVAELKNDICKDASLPTEAERKELRSCTGEILETLDYVITTFPQIHFFVDINERNTLCSLFLLDTCLQEDGVDITSVWGVSHVHPDDQFDKDIGRVVALKYAMDQLPKITEKTRREIMSGYYSR